MSNHALTTYVLSLKKGSIWVFWLGLGVAIAVYLTISFIGNVLIIGMKLGAIHPAIEWLFYAALIAVFVWLIVMPLFRVLSFPEIALEDIDKEDFKTKVDYKTLRKIVQKLIDSNVLEPAPNTKEGSEEEKNKKMLLAELNRALKKKGDLRSPLSKAVAFQKATANKIIHESAVVVFVSTTISQNGRLDAISVLVANFRLVNNLVNHFGYRPPLPTLIKIYTQIFIIALVADEIDDIDLAETLEELAPGLFTAIPGTSLIINSLINGSLNALLTLRIGFIAKKCLLNIGSFTKKEIRKDANAEAIKEFEAVRKRASEIIQKKIKDTSIIKMIKDFFS